MKTLQDYHNDPKDILEYIKGDVYNVSRPDSVIIRELVGVIRLLILEIGVLKDKARR